MLRGEDYGIPRQRVRQQMLLSSMNILYDDDAIMGKNAPSLRVLITFKVLLPNTEAHRRVVLGQFLKWQVYPAMKACEALHQSGIVNVVGVATDPKRSAVERHIEKERSITYALCFDESDSSPVDR